jgi:hypothetical protein
MTDTLFALVADEHPLRPAIDRFQGEVRRRRPIGALAESTGLSTVHADLKAEPAAGHARITSLYWSLQRSGDGRFSADTLVHAGAVGRAEWLDFPDDPRLPGLGGYLDRNPDAEVLRYSPLRRLTLRLGPPSGDALVVAKFKHTARFHHAWTMLQLVERRIVDAGVSFRVPRSLALDHRRGLYVQQSMPGRTLSTLVDAPSAPRLLSRLGALHRELHALSVDGLPLRATRTGTSRCWWRHWTTRSRA